MTFDPRTLIAALLFVVMTGSGCAWRRLDPPRVERPALPVVDEAVGLAAADEETSLTDLRALSRTWTQWGAFRAVQFPYRDGDPVDLVLNVRLRQRADAHWGTNMLKAFAVGLSFWTLTPVLGIRISELHDVRVECRRGDVVGVAVEETVRSDAEVGYAADAVTSAKQLDDIQMQQLASKILGGVASRCRAPPRP